MVFRTDPGSKLDAATAGATVAFEVDADDERGRTGCSVVIRGQAAEVAELADLERLRVLPLYPWAPGADAPLRADPARVGHRPAHRAPGRPAVHLVGLMGAPR